MSALPAISGRPPGALEEKKTRSVYRPGSSGPWSHQVKQWEEERAEHRKTLSGRKEKIGENVYFLSPEFEADYRTPDSDASDWGEDRKRISARLIKQGLYGPQHRMEAIESEKALGVKKEAKTWSSRSRSRRSRQSTVLTDPREVSSRSRRSRRSRMSSNSTALTDQRDVSGKTMLGQ